MTHLRNHTMTHFEVDEAQEQQTVQLCAKVLKANRTQLLGVEVVCDEKSSSECPELDKQWLILRNQSG